MTLVAWTSKSYLESNVNSKEHISVNLAAKDSRNYITRILHRFS